MRLTRVCSEDGCPEFAVTGTTRCGSHPPKRSPSSQHTSTSPWKRLRLRILERDNYTCHYCGARATHVDHVEPVHAGGDDSKLVAACAACNLSKGGRVGRH